MKFSKGFSLMELIIVIAIIGILAAVVLAVINPLEQMAKTRDAGRRNSVSQLGKAVEAYNISLGSYPAASATWQDLLGPNGTGDLKQVLSISGAPADCAINNHNNFCYDTTTTPSDAAVWTISESKTDKSKCGSDVAIIIWIASQGKTGIGCVANATAAPSTPYSSFLIKE